MDPEELERRLQAPLVPLKHVKQLHDTPGYIPLRSASLPASAPFGTAWHAQHGQWQCETLAFPAAYPRSVARSTTSQHDVSSASTSQKQRITKQNLDKAVADLVNNQKNARRNPPNPASCNGPNPLWIAVNRYTPASRSQQEQNKSTSSTKDPVTLVFAHANGFSKETWEATLAETLANWDTEASGEIEDVFMLDMVNQGDAAILNQDTLGSTFEWSDNGRDILQFILSYLPESHQKPSTSSKYSKPSHSPGKPFFYSKDDASLSHWSEDPSANAATSSKPASAGGRGVGGYITEDPSMSAPTKHGNEAAAPANSFRPRTLPFQSPPDDLQDLLLLDESKHSSRNTKATSFLPANPIRWRGRRIVLIGHSVGAAGMIYTASTFPQLFETLIIVDPTIFPKDVMREPFTLALTAGAVIRRDSWSSREEARSLFQKNKGFFGKWHPDVLNGYVEFGLRDARDGKGVSLKVDKMQEAYVFADTDNIGSKRAFHRLALIPPTLNLHIIRADVGNSTVPEESYPAFHEIVKHASHTRISGAGHLIPQELPKQLAAELVGYSKNLEKSAFLGVKAKL